MIAGHVVNVRGEGSMRRFINSVFDAIYPLDPWHPDRTPFAAKVLVLLLLVALVIICVK